MGTQQVGKPLYTSDIIMRAFQFFATSRCLYERLRHDFQLPSAQTLTRITSKVGKLDECTFSGAVFKTLEERQRLCVLLRDEVYVKKMMLYHGGQVFGRSVDDPQCLAKTALGIMISCMFGAPNFLPKILPILRLKTSFLHEQIQLSLAAIEQAGGRVKAIICDGNRNNQAFFQLLGANRQRPWDTQAGVYLLYEYVHILKNIRNNWLTEATGELSYYHDGVWRTAKWNHLVELYKLEADSLVKMSTLDEVSVLPKPSERQKVST
ncbi:transposable element p transposase [Plakobranchus ocellatus]|uniref:Transposable element p transposase n=1 Tax=Plakobranchus ocellatus TaxID=259542 RepID=A0AAV4CMW8_9GAST|nr:transposable element p transposase [Plakobranchus ocellatus]